MGTCILPRARAARQTLLFRQELVPDIRWFFFVFLTVTSRMQTLPLQIRCTQWI